MQVEPRGPTPHCRSGKCPLARSCLCSARLIPSSTAGSQGVLLNSGSGGWGVSVQVQSYCRDIPRICATWLWDWFQYWHLHLVWILTTLFSISDLPSGETQHQGPWVGRALRAAPALLPAGEPGLSHRCHEGHVTDLRALLHSCSRTGRCRNLERVEWNLAFWCLPHVHTLTDTFLKSQFGAIREIKVRWSNNFSY